MEFIYFNEQWNELDDIDKNDTHMDEVDKKTSSLE